MPSTIETLQSSDTQVGALTREISKYRYNAAGIQRVVLTNLREILNGEYDIVDATSPFVMLMESSCVNTAAFMVENLPTTASSILLQRRQRMICICICPIRNTSIVSLLHLRLAFLC